MSALLVGATSSATDDGPATLDCDPMVFVSKQAGDEDVWVSVADSESRSPMSAPLT